MKKFISLILAMLLLLSLAACGDGETPDEPVSGETKETKQTTESSKTTEPAKEEETEPTVDLEDWGYEELFTTDDGENIDRYTIHVPKRGSYYSSAKIAESLNYTGTMISGQYVDPYVSMPKVATASEVFSIYTEFTISALEQLYYRGSNFNISIDESEMVTIGDHEMCINRGTISYDSKDTHRAYNYVAYSTIMHDSGNAAYWMAYDMSKDQSNGELIEEHALNMAKTFKEEE